ncbi:hypothetical protein UZ36_07450, partial [Candidatus Nitromaritima sp. SCGC AAA799-C22]
VCPVVWEDGRGNPTSYPMRATLSCKREITGVQGRIGAEVQRLPATVVIGGILSSTALTLLDIFQYPHSAIPNRNFPSMVPDVLVVCFNEMDTHESIRF